jgi:hypothetical protein
MTGFRFPTAAMTGYFSLWHRVQSGSGAHLVSYSTGTRGLSPVVKRSGCETDQSPQSSAMVKHSWSYASTPQFAFMACCLIKQWVRLHIMVLIQAQKQLYLFHYTFLRLTIINMFCCNTFCSLGVGICGRTDMTCPTCLHIMQITHMNVIKLLLISKEEPTNTWQFLHWEGISVLCLRT